MHMAEHRVNTYVYVKSHKPHHKFVNPIVFDAFDGSLTDTLLMILVPMTITTQVLLPFAYRIAFLDQLPH